MNKNEFVLALKNLGIDITEEKLNKLDKYYDLLIEWNNKINLTRITDKEEVYLKHFYDSLTIYKMMNLNNNLSLCDIGSGAGFPGIVLKIVFPNLKITLLDSLGKRIDFLNVVGRRAAGAGGDAGTTGAWTGGCGGARCLHSH